MPSRSQISELNELANAVSYGDIHNGVNIVVRRMTDVNDEMKEQFNLIAEPLLRIAKQLKRSIWDRVAVNSLRVEPLEENSWLCGDYSAFELRVSENAIKDTAKNLGLAISRDGWYYPLRDTAYKSLLDRARISGTALLKLRRRDLSNTLNACLALYKDNAMTLFRNQKITAVHFGGENDYSILPINESSPSNLLK